MNKGLSPAGAAGFFVATFIVGLAAGLCFRAPFDDEAIALAQFDLLSLGELLRFYLGGGDVHPPLAFALFKLLSMVGVGEAGLRIVSLAAAIGAFALALDLSLRTWGGERATRAMIVAVFAASPILYGVGDSVRWYSLLALFSALMFHQLLRKQCLTLGAGALLGLAAGTSFLAVIPAIGVAAWHYGFRRQHPALGDLKFWAAVALLGAPGLIAFANALPNIGPQTSGGTLAALGYSAIGYFGGARLGLLPALLAVPAVLWVMGAVVTALRKLKRDGRSGAGADLLFVALVQIALCIGLVAWGFDKPRSFLFVAPLVSAVMAATLPSLAARPLMRAAAYVAMLLPLIAVLGSVRASDRPFKREMALPMREIVSFIAQAAPPPARIISSSPSLGYRLYRAGYCVRARSLMAVCERAEAVPGQAIIIIRDQALASTPEVLAWIEQATSGRKLVERRQFGHDAEAALKTRLSGVALPEWLIEVEIWR